MKNILILLLDIFIATSIRFTNISLQEKEPAGKKIFIVTSAERGTQSIEG